jgi:D-alanine transaminase
MPRISYVNGRYVRHADAADHIEDRGYQFADGVYEVIAVRGGMPAALDQHLTRLRRSLGEVRIDPPVGVPALRQILRRVIALNRLREGTLYLQISRGVAARDHAFPSDARAQLVLTPKRAKPSDPKHLAEGVRIVTIPEERWLRRDIKSISLLPNVLGKQRAREAGAYEAWQVDEDGNVTEGTSSNAWIVTQSGELVTAPLGHTILGGITRLNLLACAKAAGFTVAERAFSADEAKSAREAFLTSTTSLVMPVTQIDDRVIGNGRPGSITVSLRAALIRHLDGAASQLPEYGH